MDLKRVCDNGEQALCFSGGTPQIWGYLTSNSYAAYLEMVQKKKEIMEKSDGCWTISYKDAISNKDEDAEMGVMHDFWVKWDHLRTARFNRIKKKSNVL